MNKIRQILAFVRSLLDFLLNLGSHTPQKQPPHDTTDTPTEPTPPLSPTSACSPWPASSCWRHSPSCWTCGRRRWRLSGRYSRSRPPLARPLEPAGLGADTLGGAELAGKDMAPLGEKKTAESNSY